MNQLRQFWSLFRLATTELFRRPACFLLTVSCIAATLIAPMAISHQMGQEAHLAVDSSLAFELVFGLVLAGYAACSTIDDECRSGTILVVFSKPVGRILFLAAKFTAVCAVITFFVYCCGAATLLAGRLTPRNFEFDEFGLKLILLLPVATFLPALIINLRTRKSFIPPALTGLALSLTALVAILGFTDTEGHRATFGTHIDWSLIPASLMEGMALLILAAIAISLATRLSRPPTTALLVGILFTGLISDHLGSLLGTVPGAVLRTLLPDLQAFWPADLLTGGGTVSAAMLTHAAGYATLYSFGVLCLGYQAFRNRQF